MSARSFRPVMSVATVAVAALGCYLVSLRVAAERAGLEEVESRIVLAQRDIRTLQTEIGTRGRLEQLERWNVRVLALSAPKADQFVDGGYQLARLARPTDEVDLTAPVVLAAAPKPAPAQPIATPVADDDADVAASENATQNAPAPRAAPASGGPASMMHVASYRVSGREEPAVSTARPLSRKSPAIVSATTKPAKFATVAKPPHLPGTGHDAKASSHAPAKAGVARDEAPH
ncbi:MAG: hypothetical protein ABIQ98_04120 [Sphingomicrobium sp.]